MNVIREEVHVSNTLVKNKHPYPMSNKNKSLWPVMLLAVMGLLANAQTAFSQPGGRPNMPSIPPKGDTTRTLTRHFVPAPKEKKKAPDANGFIQRWLVLQPVRKEIPRNSILTEEYLRNVVANENFSPDLNAVPKDGKTATIGGKKLKWYALDSKTFNFNFYNFTYAINEPPYGVLFWMVTVIDSPEEIKNVRMAAGVNSAGMFWLNGEEALLLNGDRDMVVDNVTSKRLTLKKGRNVVRGLVLNGQGMCNLVVRFLDENGNPVTNFTTSYE